MPQYLLSAHSYVCFADEYAVFLDLKRDKYTALAPEDARSLTSLVRGWPHFNSANQGGPSAPPSTDIVSTLVTEGLLTQAETTGKSAAPITLERATMDITASLEKPTRITYRDWWRFLAAWTTTTLMLRFLPLRYAVSRTQRRKARTRHPISLDIHSAHKLLAVYLSLRPHFFSHADACLRDSLTFVEFLSRYKLHPTCVFGVRMNPFLAHAWVQESTVVLNDRVEHINQFIPIMAI